MRWQRRNRADLSLIQGLALVSVLLAKCENSRAFPHPT
jgi:hypothetical protein